MTRGQFVNPQNQAAMEEGLNEGIRAMFSAGLGGALMKVGPFGSF